MLSFTQSSLWLMHELAGPDEPAYNESVMFEIRGSVDPGALRAAVRALVQRHEALRTAFLDTSHGPRAHVRDTAPDPTTFVDLRGTESDTGVDARARADELMAEHHRRPFDLGTVPLLRVLLVALPGDVWMFGLTAHHIVIDDWSLRLILDEVGENYRAVVATGRLPDRPVSGAAFRRFVAASRADAGDMAGRLDRWVRSLENRPEVLGIPLDRPRPAVQTFHGDSITLTVPRADVEPLLRECARECRSTAFPVFLAAYAVLLQRYTRQDGFVIGTTVLNRPTDDDLTQVGCYVNTLPLFVAVDPDDTFRTVLGRAQEAADRMLDDGDVPYPTLVEALGAERPRNYNPVFQTMLTMLGGRPTLDLAPAAPAASGPTAEYRPLRRVAAKFDLMLYVSPADDGFEFEFEFNTDLFTRATAGRMLRNYAQLLRSLAGAGIDTAVSVPSMTRDADRHLLLGEWNDTRTEYPGGTVADTVEERVRRCPDAPAVEFDGVRLTYDALNREANRVANRIRRLLGTSRSGVFVGVYMERSVEMVVALLAVVKAGHAYVPIDPDYPVARVDFMIDDADLPLILTQERFGPALAARAAARVLVLPDPTLRDEDDSDPVRELGPASPVYMIYTSGSTGRPKGVINRHDALANRLHWMQSAYPLTGADRVLQKTPYSFDVSVWEFFWPLMFGAAIVVAKPGGHRDPDYLKHVIRSAAVTTVHFVPSMLNVFLEAGGLADDCGSLRRVVCSGEALPRRTVEVFFATLPSCELHNLYGPTEAAIDVSAWACTLDYPGDLVPIGRPIANVRLYVLDEALRLQPVGVPGELCIGGVAVATGYHNRDELTARMFVTDPYAPAPGGRLYRTGDLARFLPDGQIQYLGRIDNQVKLHGLRVEPDEIAAVLRQVPGVQDAAVVLHDSGTAQALAAYVVSAAFDAEDLRRRLRGSLPEFLVPQYLVEVPALPTTPNGKLDRRALPAPASGAPAPTGEAGPAGGAPSTDAERDVARVWQEVLGPVGPLGVADTFFALGGDSILALRVVTRLRAAGYSVGVRDVFARTSVAELAASLSREPAAGAWSDMPAFALLSDADRGLLPPEAEDAWPLTRLQSGMIYHSLLDEGSPVYHDIFDYELVGTATDVARLERAIRDTVAAHPMLRSTFDLDRYGEPLQIVLPAGATTEPPVGIVDVTHLSRAAQDRAVEGWVESEKRRPLEITGPLIRFCLHVRPGHRINLAVSFHHLILDGWSVAIVVEEIRRRYADLLAGRPAGAAAPPEPSFATYVALERESMRREEDRAAWRALLDGFPGTLVAGPRTPADEIEASTVERTVPPALEQRLRRRAAALGIPLKSMYLAAHCAALAGLTGAGRVITGLVGNGRPEIPGGSEMVGLFLNTLPFPVEVGDADLPTLPATVFDRERRLVPLQRFPLAGLEQLRGGALFDVVFNYTVFHPYAGAGSGVSIEKARYFELTNFPMTVHVHHDHFDGSTQLVVAHDAVRIKAGTVEAFVDDLLAALDGYGGGPADATDAPDGEELAVARIIAQVVGRETLGVNENYLDAGVDSISSIRILVKLRKLFPGAAMRDVMEARTARLLLLRVRRRPADAGAVRAPGGGAEPAAGPPARALPGGVVDAYPVTATQLHMLEATRRDPAQSAFHDVFAYRVALPLDGHLLRAGLRRMVDACETLRTEFDLDASRQLVHASVEPDLTVVDAVGDPAAADDWFDHERGSGFAWNRPGLIRFAAHRTAEDGFVLSLSFHHAIVDGWSLSLLVRDLLLFYAAGLRGEVLHPEFNRTGAFRDHVMAEVTARSSAESRDFWRAVLAGHPGTTLPSFRSDGSDTRWAEATVTASREREARLLESARLAGLPLKYVLLAAHLRVLSLVTGEADVVSGVFTHGRPETDDAVTLIGMFLQFQPHRLRFDTQTWPEVVDRVFAFEMRALAHRRCAAPVATPGYAALFNYTDFPAYAEIPSGHLAGVRWFEHTDAAYLATVGREPTGSALEITLNASGRVLPPAVLDDLAGLYSAVLTQIADDPAGRVHHVTDEVRARTAALRTRQLPRP